MEIVEGKLSYEKIRPIGVGEGANSLVFEGREPNLGRVVAIKEIDRADLSVRGIYDYFQEAKRMFELQHRHVVPIFTAVDAPNCVALLMPYYPAGSLARQLEATPISPLRALEVAQSVLEGLAHIHIAGFLHFDIKPSNVLFAPGGRPMLADFGQTRMLEKAGIAGAPSMYKYVAPPEVLKTGVGTVESDIFQFGLLLYRMVNGDPHYQAMKNQQIARHGGLRECLQKGEIADLSSFLPHVPNRMKRVIRIALDPNPRNRFGTAQELADELARVEINNDWRVSTADGDVRWTCERKGRANLSVSRVACTSREGRFDVQAHTVSNSGRRALRQAELWGSGLTPKLADHLLQGVFRELEKG